MHSIASFKTFETPSNQHSWHQCIITLSFVFLHKGRGLCDVSLVFSPYFNTNTQLVVWVEKNFLLQLIFQLMNRGLSGNSLEKYKWWMKNPRFKRWSNLKIVFKWPV